MAMDLSALSDEELDAAHMQVQESRAKAEAELKAEATAIQKERDRRSLAVRIAAVDDDVIAAIRAARPKAKEG